MRRIALAAVFLLAAGCLDAQESNRDAIACDDDASPAYQAGCPSGAQDDIDNSTTQTPEDAGPAPTATY